MSKNSIKGSRNGDATSEGIIKDDYALALFKKIKAGEMTLKEVEMTVENEAVINKVRSYFKGQIPDTKNKTFDRNAYFSLKEFAKACQLTYAGAYSCLLKPEIKKQFVLKIGKNVFISKNIFQSSLWKKKRIDKMGRGFVIHNNNQEMRAQTLRENAGGLLQYESKLFDEAITHLESNIATLHKAKEILKKINIKD